MIASRTLDDCKPLQVPVSSSAISYPCPIAHTVIETAKMNNLDPQDWLADALHRIPEHHDDSIDELLPGTASPTTPYPTPPVPARAGSPHAFKTPVESASD